MRTQTGQFKRILDTLRAPRLAIAAISLLAAHLLVLVVLSPSQPVGFASDMAQLACALCSAIACLLTSRQSHGIARPFWYLTSITFAAWSLGKGLIMYDFQYLGLQTIPIVPVLLVFLSAAPMFVAIFLSDENLGGSISWEWVLDASQILGLILVIYLFLIYIPLLYSGEQSVTALEDRLLLWRNLVLAAGLLARAIFTHSRTVRRLYLPIAAIVGIFAITTWFGNRAQSASDAPALAWYDLAWSVPFCLISLAAAFWQDSPEEVSAPLQIPGISRVIFVYLPALVLPVMLLLKYHTVVREQIFLGLFGLIFSILLFNARLLLTHRRQRLTAAALQQKENQYRSLFERNMAGVFRCTLDGQLIDCNPAYAAMFGYSREELRHTPLHDLYFGGAAERNQWIATIPADGPAAPHEFCLRRKDGSPLWGILNANTEKQPDGSTVLEGTIVDVTEQRLSTFAVEDWKRRYDAAVVASGQIIYESDPDSRRVTLGGCVPEVLGYTAEELSGDSTAWLALIHPEDSAHYREQIRSAVNSPGTIAFEYRARRKENGFRTLWEQGRAIRDSQGRVIRIVGFISDITERRTLESQLRQAQKMEAVGRLAGGVAHDFNNLLTIISGYSSMQLDRTPKSDPVHHEAEQIRAAADRAAALTRQLLAFSRQQVLQPRNLNLNDNVRALDKMLRRLIGEDIEVLTSLAPNLGTVKVDPGQIDQVLMNLVVNSRDAMPDGGKLTIQTENIQLDDNYTRKHEYVKPGRYVLLAVSDSGTGIDAQTQTRIFEPFFTTKEPGKGTGLGLPMVYGIVKQSGGSIEVYSEVGEGTTIKIFLPRVDANVEATTSSGNQPAQMRGSETILLVEDDALVRRLAADILSAHGYTVHSAGSVGDLEALLQQVRSCDLLLTDVVMPKLRGPELAARVTRQWPDIKVLYMSGYTTNAIVHHGVLEEGLFFLQKPFVPNTLISKVREVLSAPTSVKAR